MDICLEQNFRPALNNTKIMFDLKTYKSATFLHIQTKVRNMLCSKKKYLCTCVLPCLWPWLLLSEEKQSFTYLSDNILSFQQIDVWVSPQHQSLNGYKASEKTSGFVLDIEQCVFFYLSSCLPESGKIYPAAIILLQPQREYILLAGILLFLMYLMHLKIYF